MQATKYTLSNYKIASGMKKLHCGNHFLGVNQQQLQEFLIKGVNFVVDEIRAEVTFINTKPPVTKEPQNNKS